MMSAKSQGISVGLAVAIQHNLAVKHFRTASFQKWESGIRDDLTKISSFSLTVLHAV